MDAHTRRLGLGVAIVLLVLLELAVRRFDLLGRLVADTLPSTLFAAVNAQLTDVVRALRGRDAGSRPVVLVGNSQMDMGSRPLPALREAMVRAGAPAETRVVPLFVYATAITDAEVLSRSLGALAPGLTILGVSAPDVGTPLERARLGPVTQTLDVGLGDGLVRPADLEARLDRWARSASQLYRYRGLFADLLLPATGRRTPRAFFERGHGEAEFFTTVHGTERGEELVRLRREALERGDFASTARYVEALQGPAYLPGLRDRWRSLEPESLQLEALGRFTRQVRASGGRPVIVLLPENPILERDPEIGRDVEQRSNAAAAAVSATAAPLGVEVIDLRRGTPPEAFLDLNHLFFEHGGLAPRLADALAERGLLAPPA